MSGLVIALVGPSGAGKDTLIDLVLPRIPQVQKVRRVITRRQDAGGETFDGVSLDAFNEMKANGSFCLSWEAHGHSYGVPAYVSENSGQTYLFNGARRALGEAESLFENFHVLEITASPEVLAERLAARGRETAEQIKERLSVQDWRVPDRFNPTIIDNSGDLATAEAALFDALTQLVARA